MAFGRKKKEDVTWSGETASQVSQRDVDNRTGSLASGACRHDKGTQTPVGQRSENGVHGTEIHCGNCDSNYMQFHFS